MVQIALILGPSRYTTHRASNTICPYLLFLTYIHNTVLLSTADARTALSTPFRGEQVLQLQYCPPK